LFLFWKLEARESGLETEGAKPRDLDDLRQNGERGPPIHCVRKGEREGLSLTA